MKDKTVLLTGAAGFIGFHTCLALLALGHRVIGLDSLNPYYDPMLKKARLKMLETHRAFSFMGGDITHETWVDEVIKNHPDITHIVHLAAQAGVRYSLENPLAYIDSNVRGHAIMLEAARKLSYLEHMVYASSSSVYGGNTKRPFAAQDRTDHPLSLYAATKKSCELMASCYNHLYATPLTGLRFFTVYGPWGRPDMSAFIFTKAILEEKPMSVFNHGRMRRNFTYIDDVVDGIVRCLALPSQKEHKVYNIGNDRSESLMDFIALLEKHLDKKANIDFQPMQPGDVPETVADIEETSKAFGFYPKTNIDEGLHSFVSWYRSYYGYEQNPGG